MAIEKDKLFVGNLDHNVKWFHLKKFFAQFGEVTYTKVVIDKTTGKSRGFGFVVFASEEQAQYALDHANGQDIVVNEASFTDRPIRLMFAEVSDNYQARNEAHEE